jgi:hypothetical protein
VLCQPDTPTPTDTENLTQNPTPSLYSTPKRKLRTGACPVAGLPRFLRNTTFGVDIKLSYEKNWLARPRSELMTNPVGGALPFT